MSYRHVARLPLLLALLLIAAAAPAFAQTPYLVKDIVPGPRSSSPSKLIEFKGNLLFAVDDALWVSDGTDAGTALLKRTGSIDSNLVDVGDRVVFIAGKYIWSSDGTSNGTQQVEKLHNDSGFTLSNLVNVKGAALFTLYEPGHKTVTLWRSDGTEAGTDAVKELCSARCATLAQLTVVNNAAYLITSADSFQLWKTDGSTDGTNVVRAFSLVGDLTAANGTLYLSAAEGSSGLELWKSDGTSAGTVMVKDICPGFCSGTPVFFADSATGGSLLFAGIDGKHGVSLWKSDGTEKNTTMVKAVVPGLTATPAQSFATVNGTTYFAAFEPESLTELWKSDGTSAGTVMVKDICPRCSSNPSFLTAVNGELFFSAADGTNGTELWSSDGTAANTLMVADIKPGPGGSSPSDLVAVGTRLFFTANDGTHGRELWAVDAAPVLPPLGAQIPAEPPTVSSVTPTGGSGNATFTFAFSDASGYENLTEVQGIINLSVEYAGSCSFMYQPSQGVIYVRSDDGSTWNGPAKLGQAGTLGGGQCTIDVGAASATGSGNQLFLSLPVTFNSSFVGQQHIYARAANSVGASGWQDMGLWTSFAPLATAPSVDGVTPNKATGFSQKLTFQFSSVNGYSYIGWVQGIVNTSIDYAASCSFNYERSSNRLYLMNDAGNQWMGPVTPGGTGTLSNKQCTIDAAGSSVAGAGNTLSLTLAITESSSVAGIQNVYAYAADNGNLRSGWAAVGTWVPTAPQSNTPPKAVSATSVPGMTTFVFASDNGGSYISEVQTMVAASFGYANSCSLYYFATNNRLYLMNDTGDKWLGPVLIGQPGSLSNTQCTVDASLSSTSVSGTALTLNLATAYSPTLAGAQYGWGYALDKMMTKSWTYLGSLSVQ